VQVDGFEVPGVTGRPWHPPHLAALLEAAGAVSVSDQPTWRIDLATAWPEAPVPGTAPSEPEEREPASLVPRLAAVARAAGYRWLVAPWSADPRAEPEAVHRTYRVGW
jgi:hypothetical protein